MMTNSQLWAENEVLREKLHELLRVYEKERELRLTYQAENLWIKKLLKTQLDGPTGFDPTRPGRQFAG